MQRQDASSPRVVLGALRRLRLSIARGLVYDRTVESFRALDAALARRATRG